MLWADLSEIHSKSGIYNEKKIKGDIKENILSDVSSISVLNHLTEYYEKYFQQYQKFTKGNWRTNFKGDKSPAPQIFLS